MLCSFSARVDLPVQLSPMIPITISLLLTFGLDTPMVCTVTIEWPFENHISTVSFVIDAVLGLQNGGVRKDGGGDPQAVGPHGRRGVQVVRGVRAFDQTAHSRSAQSARRRALRMNRHPPGMRDARGTQAAMSCFLSIRRAGEGKACIPPGLSPSVMPRIHTAKRRQRTQKGRYPEPGYRPCRAGGFTSAWPTGS